MSRRIALLLLLLLPFQFFVSLSSAGGFPMARLLVGILILVYFMEQLFLRRFPLPLFFIFSCLLPFLWWSTLSLSWGGKPFLGYPRLFFLWNFFPLILVWYGLFRDGERTQRVLFRSLFLGAGSVAVISLLLFLSQFLFGVSETFHFLLDHILPFFLGEEFAHRVALYPSLLVNIQGETLLRVTAFFPDPHVAAYFFGLMGFFTLGAKKWFTSWERNTFIFLFFSAQLLTFSRGGYLGILAGIVLYILMMRPVRLSLTQIFSFSRMRRVGWWSVAFLLLFGGPVFARFLTSFTFTDASSVDRLLLWREVGKSIVTHPLVGVGLGQLTAELRPLLPPESPFYAHNLYLDIASEVGLVGLVLFLGVINFPVIALFWAKRYRKISVDPHLSAAIFSGWMLYLVHSLFENALFSIHVATLLTFLIGLALALSDPQETSETVTI